MMIYMWINKKEQNVYFKKNVKILFYSKNPFQNIKFYFCALARLGL